MITGMAVVSAPTAAAATNVALNKPATGSASCAPDESPAKAVNGSVSGGNADKWCSSAGTKFLQVDLGSAINIGQFVVRHAGAGGESADMNTRAFTIQVSTNGTTFTTAVTVTANAANVSTHDIAAISARHVRLSVTQPEQGGGGAARIYELEVYDTGGGQPPGNLALNRPATGSAPCAAAEGPEKAVNGSVSGGNGDKWCSSADGTKFLQVDLQSTLNVGGAIIRHAGAGGESADFNTSGFTVQVSTNGTTFTTVATVSGNTANVTRHTWTQRGVRFVRLNVTAPTAGGGGAARIYEFEVYLDPPPVGGDPGTCHPDAPPTLNDYISDHATAMTRVSCNADAAVYFDAALLALPPAQTAWAPPFVAEVWRHYRDTYGSCAVNRPLPAPIGPNCVRFGHPKPLIAFFHQDRFHGGTVANRFDGFSGFRNTIDVGDNGWSINNATLRDVITHEECHIVEGASQGVHESPAFGEIWGDSKWAEICQYDFYRRSGRTADATRVFDQYMNNRDDLPQGANDVAWFRDWFHPLYVETGSNMAFMDRFYGLLNQHFPKRQENDNRNLIYTRRMNAGEFVHFMSGAVGRDLSNVAQQAFNSGFSRAQFDQARTAFPGITY
ncbi:discoidin domain-containing protein [Lentzea tibetensis]|uniref:discoidin domain-containing protein n=1 Tax=Lentzea tibetensis TaxID=2591470 RepID=UPI001C99F739|nr:discoidin domain-containing protein [Lentzea tibetensis]